jgi:tRNA (cmo5U34)-methyltransferase
MDDGRSRGTDIGPSGGSETDWRTYRELAPAAVPSRAEQIATLLTLLPFEPGESFRAVELGAGEGHLSRALLDLFPDASVLALDGSAEMLDRTKARLNLFADRAVTAPFDLAAADWLPLVDGADVVVSSLCLHHLDDDGKRSLFSSLRGRMSDRGALLIADLVAPRRAEAHRLFAQTWDHIAQQQSLSEVGTGELFDLFVATEWNIYRYPDPMDTPSPLSDQLRWLEQAGFHSVDCFWMRAAHAIYGGFCTPGPGAPNGVSYADALAAAQSALRN